MNNRCIDANKIKEFIHLGGAEYDTNGLKIQKLLDINKVEHRKKNGFYNAKRDSLSLDSYNIQPTYNVIDTIFHIHCY